MIPIHFTNYVQQSLKWWYICRTYHNTVVWLVGWVTCQYMYFMLPWYLHHYKQVPKRKKDLVFLICGCVFCLVIFIGLLRFNRHYVFLLELYKSWGKKIPLGGGGFFNKIFNHEYHLQVLGPHTKKLFYFLIFHENLHHFLKNL